MNILPIRTSSSTFPLFQHPSKKSVAPPSILALIFEEIGLPTVPVTSGDMQQFRKSLLSATLIVTGPQSDRWRLYTIRNDKPLLLASIAFLCKTNSPNCLPKWSPRWWHPNLYPTLAMRHKGLFLSTASARWEIPGAHLLKRCFLSPPTIRHVKISSAALDMACITIFVSMLAGVSRQLSSLTLLNQRYLELGDVPAPFPDLREVNITATVNALPPGYLTTLATLEGLV
ncbi:hypothetical protein FB451DRAFT_1566227 [Mycena latifolia]|nr:hypothetical protein FB451DRAFT_1566227 [Mycena latifolia]